MAISKVVYGANTLIDLTSDSVTAGSMTKGTTAHAADGVGITGTLKRAYTFQQVGGDYSIFCLPMADGSVSGEVWSLGSIGASVSGTVLTIGG